MIFRTDYSRREIRLAIITVTVLLGTALYAYVAEPVFASWIEVRSEAIKAAGELAEIERLVANRDTIERDFQKYAGAITTGTSKEMLQIDLLREIGEVASASGLRVTTIKPLRLQPTGGLQRLPVELHAVCAGHEFVQFLQAIQESDHLLRAKDFNVVVGRGQPPLTITLTLSKLVRIDRSSARGESDHNEF